MLYLSLIMVLFRLGWVDASSDIIVKFVISSGTYDAVLCPVICHIEDIAITSTWNSNGTQPNCLCDGFDGRAQYQELQHACAMCVREHRQHITCVL